MLTLGILEDTGIRLYYTLKTRGGVGSVLHGIPSACPLKLYNIVVCSSIVDCDLGFSGLEVPYAIIRQQPSSSFRNVVGAHEADGGEDNTTATCGRVVIPSYHAAFTAGHATNVYIRLNYRFVQG